MTAIVRILVAATLCSFLHVASASATLITFSSRALFNAAAPGLPVEDFEEGNSSIPVGFPDPLDNTTNNGVFSPGDILPGLSVDTELELTTNDLALYPAGCCGNVSKVILVNSNTDSLNLRFTSSNAVGLDVLSFNPSTVRVSIFGASDAFLNFFDVPTNEAGVFFGVINDAGPITRIHLESTGSQAFNEGADNVAFGSTVPEPASLILVGCGVAGIAAHRRRMKRRGDAVNQ